MHMHISIEKSTIIFLINFSNYNITNTFPYAFQK